MAKDAPIPVYGLRDWMQVRSQKGRSKKISSIPIETIGHVANIVNSLLSQTSSINQWIPEERRF